MSLKVSHVVLLAVALCAASGHTADRVNPDPLAALMPPLSQDSAAAAEVRAHLQSRRFAEAMRLCDSLIQSRPRNWEGYFWKGAAAIQRREFYTAVRSFRTAETLTPPGNAVAKNLAIAYYLLEQHRLFELKMREAAALDARDFAPHYFLGRYYLSSTGFEVRLAAEAFAAALERKPDDGASICFYGIALETMGEFGHAREHFERAAQRTGGQGVIASLAYQGLSRLVLSRDSASALEFARKAVTADPASAEAHLQVAKSAAAAGDRNQQLASLRSAAVLARNQARPLYQLMQIYRQLGDETEARVAQTAYERSVSCFGKEAADIR